MYKKISEILNSLESVRENLSTQNITLSKTIRDVSFVHNQTILKEVVKSEKSFKKGKKKGSNGKKSGISKKGKNNHFLEVYQIKKLITIYFLDFLINFCG